MKFRSVILALLSTTLLNLGSQTTGVAPSGTYMKTMVHLFCTGTQSTTAGTYYMPGFGGTSTACSSLPTSASGGTPAPTSTGTIKNLRALSSAAGKGSGSGVLKIYLAGTATSVTCTLGTSTSCSDTTDSATYTAGQTLTVSTASIASETLANTAISFEIW
jgi:hypothetical protein